ncbi:Stk1 family PASTA domain-containing Ser/Thr kinase [Feifania hominis]|uniref:non-specific serine/threonine protein kinase n=1 Tax=Feifania hominis TaxID=2763660 RepID=A0A926DFN5_9FIRM|nr:Stk1 family PASTA domain-containing Ser/Thr kinase [Feifania hominis]MBC8536982.1 Stk1 family PASTA domain-containing Ser/Thr kinase [Feifania hominis]
MDRLIGKIINDRYRIQSIVGTGGMSVVFKAVDMLTNQTVAVKVLKQEFLEDSQFRRRFETESNVIAMMDHENIVRILDVGLNDDLYYIVMEYVDGITLKQYIERQGPLKWRETLYFVTQVLEALEHAHNKGIVHRDIKPQNIMLLDNGSIKVTDFGIARISSTNTNTMTDKAIGSVHYISPEQVSGEKTDYRSDIYSLGVMMYEMLTNSLPFDAENPVSVALMQLQSTPKRLTEIDPEIPEGLEDIVLKAMAKSPDRRYQSAGEMLEDIERFKSNPSIRFEYEYFSDDKPTKYMDAIKLVREEEEVTTGKNKKVFLSVATGIIACFLVVGVLAAFLWPMLFPGNTAPSDIEVPTLLGQDYEAVLSNPEYEGKFRIIKISEEYNEQYGAGQIFDQDPNPGMTVKVGADIRVSVSLGEKTVVVPPLAGRDYRQAEVSLGKLGIKYEIIEEYHDTVVQDYVIRTEPAENTVVDENTVVKVYRSLGPEIKMTKVPYVIDLLENEARRELEKAGLVVGTAESVPSDKAPGVVLSQSIEAETEVSEDTVVNLTVSDGSLYPQEREITITLPQMAEPFLVTVRQSNEIVYEQTHTSDQGSLRLVLRGSGEEMVEIYINGELSQSSYVNFSD